MKIGNEKILGGLGGVGLFLSAIPTIGFILAIGGYVLFLIAIYDISKVYNDNKIFNWSLRGSILSIIVILLGIIFGISLETALVQIIDVIQMMDFSSLELKIILALVSIILLLIYANFLIYKALKKISEYTQISMFELGGRIILLGSILTPIFVGVFIFAIGWLLVGISFFKLPEEYPMLTSSSE
ncbi:MAG: hypothetical protein C0178_00910 [Sulfurihydrogenibium sp.]|nr:MAG: hypothetical protein C0178_00910 [Sulfurihydrogenibium sp.]